MLHAWLEGLGRRHGELLRAVDRLSAFASEGRDLADAIDEFLAYAADRLEPLLAGEEQHLGPLLDLHLPPDVASAQAFRREHDTLRELTEALRVARRRLPRSAAARSDAETLVSDLALLVHDHVRREDSVLGPLLERLAAGRDA